MNRLLEGIWMRRLRDSLAACAVFALVTVAGPAFAAAPKTALVDGVLTSSGGSAAADGDYDVTFTIYDAPSGGTAVWTEGPVKMKVTGGRFAHVLGSSTPMDAAKLAAAKGQWLALKIGSDPELPTQALHASIFALHAGVADKVSCDGCISGDQVANGSMAAAKMGFNYAGSNTKGGPALDLTCTGCVSVSEMKFDGDVDLAGNSLKAKNGTFAGDVTAKSVTATEFVGDGSKLTGIKTASGECKNAGEVVKGINADGSLKCVVAMDPSALPQDGLNEISNDLLSNQFTDTIQGAANVAIPDNTGADANAVLDFPDIGISQTFELTVDVSNTDLSTLALTVLPPDAKKTGWTLCDPCGDKDAKSYKKTFSKDSLPKSGDLTKWIGANIKGTWNLKALDSSYCIPQAPGNSGICDVNNKTDGKIVSWSIKIQTLSNQKVNMNGSLYVGGTLWGSENGHGKAGGPVKIGGGVQIGDEPGACTTQLENTVRVDKASGETQICQSGMWVNVARNACWGSLTHGVCLASTGGGNLNFRDSALYCASKKADICSDSQTWVLRQTAALWSNAIWTNSFSDNDAGQWSEVNGGTGDDHSWSNGWTAPCCYNATPPRASDKIVKGVRIVYKHDNASVYWRQAAMFCSGMEADLCTKAEYQVLRDNNETNKSWGYWASDHSDNDNTGYEKGIGGVSDNPNLGQHYSFICCGTHRKTLDCPAQYEDVGGVCVTKIENNTLADWPTAAKACADLNSRLCSMSQTAVLRNKGKVTASGSWTASYSDNDGNNAAIAVGSVGDDHPPSSKYGYACCLW